MVRALLSTGCVLALLATAPGSLSYPAAPHDDTADTYFGTRVSDPYRPLENANDPAVKAWAAAETKLAADYLASQPSYPLYAKRVAELFKDFPGTSDLHIAGGRFFYLRYDLGAEQPKLVTRDRLDGPERILFDPQAAAHAGAEPAIGDLYPSPDGSKLAFTTQYGGDENMTLHVVGASTGTMSDEIAHVGGGESDVALAWDADARGFVHTTWPKNGGVSNASSGIYLVHHALGSAASADTYVFGKGLSPKAEFNLLASPRGNALAIFETDGDGVPGSVFVRWRSGNIVKVATPAARIERPLASFGAWGIPIAFADNRLLVISKKDSSLGTVLAIAPGQTIATARVVVPASDVLVQSLLAVPGGFVTDDINGGDTTARLFESTGTLRARLPIPPASTAFFDADPVRGPIIIRYQNYTTPRTNLVYDPGSNTTTQSPIVATGASPDFSSVTTNRVLVPSLDGKVKIPLEIVHPKSVPMDGSAPTILTAYGAYGSINPPVFDPSLLPWFERGGVYAQAMVRGGGEYGDNWHTSSRLSTKTNSSDDLAACAQWLGAHGYGTAKHLGIYGASAGGFLMGLALSRNPERYRAVVSDVGIYDLLRWELTPNGAYNTGEFGTVKDPAQFAWMLKQSPYHNVRAGNAYPAVLMQTGENDPRVDPYNSRKMIARLQADSSSGYPVLLLQRSGQGHGIGDSLDEAIQQVVNEFAFFDSQLR